MAEIPEMSEDEKQSAIVGMALGAFYGPIWFLEEHCGEDAVEKYRELGAKGQAEMMKAMGLDTPLKVLEFNAKNEKHVLGSDVELEGNDDEATLKMNDCVRLRTALIWARAGGGGKTSTIEQGKHCQMCLQSNYKAVAEALGFDFDVDFTRLGCRITLRKKGKKED